MNFNLSSLTPASSLRVRRRRFGIGSFLFLLLFGAVFTIGGFFTQKSMKIDPNWTRVNGTVVDASMSSSSDGTSYRPIAEYTVNGQTYRVTSSTGSSTSPQDGDSRQIAYNPAQPSQAKMVEGTSTFGFIYVFIIIGIGCIVLAPLLLVRAQKRTKQIQDLLRTGLKQQGRLIEVQVINESGTNRSNPSFKVVVAAPNTTGTIQNYLSDSLYGIRGLQFVDLVNTPPITIDVYIDPSNAQNYYVNIDQLSDLSSEVLGTFVQSAVSTLTNGFYGSAPQTQSSHSAPAPLLAANQSMQHAQTSQSTPVSNDQVLPQSPQQPTPGTQFSPQSSQAKVLPVTPFSQKPPQSPAGQ